MFYNLSTGEPYHLLVIVIRMLGIVRCARCTRGETEAVVESASNFSNGAAWSSAVDHRACRPREQQPYAGSYTANPFFQCARIAVLTGNVPDWHTPTKKRRRRLPSQRLPYVGTGQEQHVIACSRCCSTFVRKTRVAYSIQELFRLYYSMDRFFAGQFFKFS